MVFSLHPEYVGQVKPDNRSWTFNHIPNREELNTAASQLFGITSFFPEYEVKAWFAGSHFSIRDDTVLVSGVRIDIYPRYYTTQVLIGTWTISRSREEVQKLCKEHTICGSVTRANVNSITLTLAHRDKDTLEHFLQHVLKPTVESLNGQIKEEKVHATYRFGSLVPKVLTHRGAARIDDGAESWNDEDAMSGSTDFNFPATRKRQHDFYESSYS